MPRAEARHGGGYNNERFLRGVSRYDEFRKHRSLCGSRLGAQRRLDGARGSLRRGDVGAFRPPHLAFLFLSPHHLHAAGSVAERAQRRLNAECLVGCTAEAVAGPGREIEQQPGLSLWLGHFPVLRTSGRCI